MLEFTVAALAITCLGLTTSLIHLRRRHRALRHTLSRVAHERDELRWKEVTRA
jgi:hypothetical protein